MTSPKTEIRDAILARQRFLISSHARPDGDAIGSELAMLTPISSVPLAFAGVALLHGDRKSTRLNSSH